MINKIETIKQKIAAAAEEINSIEANAVVEQLDPTNKIVQWRPSAYTYCELKEEQQFIYSRTLDGQLFYWAYGLLYRVTL